MIMETSDLESNQVNDRQLQVYEAPKLLAFPVPTAISLFAIVLIIVGMLWHPSDFSSPITKKSVAQTASVSVSISNTSILAHAAIVYDARTGELLFSKNPNAQLPLASVTKLMLVLTAMKTLAPHTVITITPDMLKAEGDSGFKVGEQWSLTKLVDATLVSSSNDAATALALTVGHGSLMEAVALMNKNARVLGLLQTYFLNPTGLDESATLSGAYGSAQDIARLLSYLIMNYPDAISGTTRDDMRITSDKGASVHVQNTNEALSQIPGLIAGKTGYTDLAGGNLAVAFDVEVAHPIVIVVLNSTQEGRFKDVETLVHSVRSAFQ